jgi:hypothetical protein
MVVVVVAGAALLCRSTHAYWGPIRLARILKDGHNINLSLIFG